MALNDHVFDSESPNVPHPRKHVHLLERQDSKQIMRKRKRPRIRSPHTSQRSSRHKDKSAFFQKPKLYSQASYIGPTDVEPFSTFKGTQVVDGSPEEEAFPTALCRGLGCWQMEPHSHEFPKLLETEYRRNVPQARKPHNKSFGGVFNNERDSPSWVGRHPDRAPSPLVAGPACLSKRIVEPLPARSHDRLGEEPTMPPFESPHESCSAPSNSSMLQPARGGTRDPRDALPLCPTSYETAHLRVLQTDTWQVSLPIHPKPFRQRNHEGVKGLGRGPSPKRQRPEASVMLLTAPPKKRM